MFLRYYAWVVILIMTIINVYQQNVGVNTLTAIYEWRIAQLELVFETQHKNINDCMAALPAGKAKEIYKKHNEELKEIIKKHTAKK